LHGDRPFPQALREGFPRLRKQGGDDIGVYVYDVVADLLVLNSLVDDLAGCRSGRWQI